MTHYVKAIYVAMMSEHPIVNLAQWRIAILATRQRRKAHKKIKKAAKKQKRATAKLERIKKMRVVKP